MQARSINPMNLSAAESQQLGTFLAGNEISFINKFEHYHFNDDDPVNITHHLIIDQKNPDTHAKRFYVISNEKKDILGSGATSKAKMILGFVEVDLTTKMATFTPNEQSMALRVKNTKKAQIKHVLAGTKYSHKEALQEYEIGKIFEHLGMQKPIKIKKYSKKNTSLGFFTKSYFVMNRLKGSDFTQAVENFIGNDRPTTEQMIEKVILPVLEAYKIQIADKGRVHRDIKPENIRADISMAKETSINFLDIEGCLKVGEKDKIYGSAGYFAPEIAPGNPVQPSRDIFALGVLLVGAINPMLNPIVYYSEEKSAMSAQDVAIMAMAYVQTQGCYDPAGFTSSEGNSYELFENMKNHVEDLESNDEETELTMNPLIDEAEQEIIELLKKMTDKNPANRPDIDTIIAATKNILTKLHESKAISPTSSNI